METNQIAIGQVIQDSDLQNMMPKIGDVIPDNQFESLSFENKKPQTDTYAELGLPVGDPKFLYQHGTPVLEGLGLAGGAIVGSTMGPYGAVAGAALGYGMAKQVEQLAGEFLGDRESLKTSDRFKQAANDLKLGAMFEMGGQIANKAIFEPVIKGGKWVFDVGKSYITGEAGPAATKQASKVWQANTSAGPIYAKNKQEAETIENMIPGLKFTEGQKTYDPKRIKFERVAFRKQGTAGDASVETQAANDVALKSYYQKEFGGDEGVDDFIKTLNNRYSDMQNKVEILKKTGVKLEGELEGGDVQKIHNELIDTIKANKKIAHDKAEDLYKLLPEGIELETKDMMSEFESIAQKTSEVENPKNIPEVWGRIKSKYKQDVPPELQSLIDGFKKEGKPIPKQLLELEAEYSAITELPFKEVKGIRTEILNELRTETSRQTGQNPAKIRRLTQMLNATEETLDQLATSGDENISELYSAASSKWREYKEVYESGTIGELLQKGPKGESIKLTPEQSLSKIFNSKDLRAADQLNKSIGKDQAKTLVRQYSDYDLLLKTKNPITGEVDSKKLSNWLQSNSKILDKYRLQDTYRNLDLVKRAIIQSEKNVAVFEKSQAMKMLGADPGKAIKAAFSGKGGRESAETAKQLMKIADGNPAAQAGIKRAFTDNILSEIEVTAKEITGSPVTSVAKFNNVYKKYEPALKEFYKGEPKKIKALQNMKKAYEIMIRNKTSPIGGGSDTFENTITALYQAAGHAPVGGPMKIRALRSVVRILASFKQSQVEEVLARAIFDPDVAITLEMMASGIKPEIAQKRFSGHIATLIGLSGKQLKDEFSK